MWSKEDVRELKVDWFDSIVESLVCAHFRFRKCESRQLPLHLVKSPSQALEVSYNLCRNASARTLKLCVESYRQVMYKRTPV